MYSLAWDSSFHLCDDANESHQNCVPCKCVGENACASRLPSGKSLRTVSPIDQMIYCVVVSISGSQALSSLAITLQIVICFFCVFVFFSFKSLFVLIFNQNQKYIICTGFPIERMENRDTFVFDVHAHVHRCNNDGSPAFTSYFREMMLFACLFIYLFVRDIQWLASDDGDDYVRF